MKYLKTFEQQKEPQIGDYVIVNIKYGAGRIDYFINNNIGQIRDRKYRTASPEILKKIEHIARVYYENVPKDVKDDYFHNDTIGIKKDNIVFFSNNKEDAKAYLQSKKYNL